MFLFQEYDGEPGIRGDVVPKRKLFSAKAAFTIKALVELLKLIFIVLRSIFANIVFMVHVLWICLLLLYQL